MLGADAASIDRQINTKPKIDSFRALINNQKQLCLFLYQIHRTRCITQWIIRLFVVFHRHHHHHHPKRKPVRRTNKHRIQTYRVELSRLYLYQLPPLFALTLIMSFYLLLDLLDVRRRKRF